MSARAATLTHYTLNTGHTRLSPRRDVSATAVAACQLLCAAGQHAMPGAAGYRLTTSTAEGALVATIYSPADQALGQRSPTRRPCLTLGVAIDQRSAVQLWPQLAALYHHTTDLPGWRRADFTAAQQPGTTPWLAVVLIAATPEEAAWLADFSRCLAWAWIERAQPAR